MPGSAVGAPVEIELHGAAAELVRMLIHRHKRKDALHAGQIPESGERDAFRADGIETAQSLPELKRHGVVLPDNCGCIGKCGKNHFEKLFAGTVVAVEKTFLHVRDLRAAESLEKCGAARVPHKRKRGVHDDNNFPMTLFEQSFRHLKPAGIKVGAYEVAFRIGVEKGVDEYAGRREREVRIGGEENALDSVCKHLPFGNPDLFEFGRHDGEQIIVPQRTVDHSVHELIGIEVSAADKESERPFDKFGRKRSFG